MRRLLLLLVFSSILLYSCAVPEEASPVRQETVPGVVVPSVPDSEPVESPPASVPVADDAGKAAEPSEFVYPFDGKADAPVTIVEYGDFSDVVNSQAAVSQVAAIKRDYVMSGKAKLVFKPFPLSGTADARLASEASLCMWEQGGVQFWAYHNTLFAYFSHLDEASLKNYASRVPNVDKPAFIDCLDSGTYSGIVSAVLDEGREKGISKVPAFVIGDSVFEGDVPYKKLKSAIDAELSSNDGRLITGNAVFSQSGFIEALSSFFRKI